MMDRELMQLLQLPTGRVLTFGGKVSVPEYRFFEGVRKLLTTPKSAEVADVQGRGVKLVKSGLALQLEIGGKVEASLKLSSFGLLSAEVDERVASLREILEMCGPAAVDLTPYLETARKRELSDAEVAEILGEVGSGVTALWGRAADAFRRGSLTVGDIVPSDVRYFEKLCGPDPGVVGADSYVANALRTHRENLIARDLRRGLEICMIGALREELSPTVWLKPLSDDKVWDVLNSVGFESDPYSLLSAFEISVERSRDNRFRRLAEKVAKKLASESLKDKKGCDGYEMLPVFATLTLNRLNDLEEAASRPPYWRRLCAWTHAGALVRLARGRAISVESIGPWIKGQLSQSGVLRSTFDFRDEPMYSAMMTTPESLRDELLGRVALFEVQSRSAGKAIPGKKTISNWISKRRSTRLPLMCLSPGPLQGHARPKQAVDGVIGRRQMNRIWQDQGKEPLGRAWVVLAQISQVCVLDEKSVDGAVKRMAAPEIFDGADLDKVHLLDAALVANAIGNVGLAREVTRSAIRLAPKVKSEEHAIDLMHAMFVASCCTEDRVEWERGIREAAQELSVQLPATQEARDTCIAMLATLDRLGVVGISVSSKARSILASS